jgi:hypothetical protein
LTTGSSTTCPHLAVGTPFPILNTSGRIADDGADGNDNECNNEGRIRYVRNGAGSVSIESLIVRNNDCFSPSDASSKLSNPSTRSMSGLEAKKPAAESSETKLVVGRRVRAFGLSMRLYRGNKERGREPIVEGCGVVVKLGRGWFGLYIEKRRRASW